MSTKSSIIEKKLVSEIKNIPDEYLPNLLLIVQSYKDSVTLKSADESFRQGFSEALGGNTKPVSELWSDIGE